ncbi:MAG: hypothetical protein V3G42_02680 [Oscillospiraceae bacterium]
MARSGKRGAVSCIHTLQQIEDRQYEIGLKNQGYQDILKYGIAFCGKYCKVMM